MRIAMATVGLCHLFISLATGQDDVALVSADYQQLLAKKHEYQPIDGETPAPIRSLVAKADRLLQQEPVTVMQKKQIAASGDKHDYLSLAPYWWPDPKTTDGLPYIRRDGRVNPTTRGNNVDYPAKQHLFDRVHTLTMAGFYTDNPEYSQHAVAQLEAWFVDPRTRMTPHLQYAQGIPGLNDGRCFGIIEWCDIDKLLTPIQVLRTSQAIPGPTDQAITQWFESYLQWLRTSEMGRTECERLNNHGTWYDVQIVGLLLFLGKKMEMRDVLETVKAKRIATQIEPDGRQPHELARTKSLSYSKMNLSAFQRLARLGEKVGVDLGSYETPDGRSITKARAFLAPYIKGDKKWDYQQL
ncbi:Alginate lyase [Planctomycetes bacterium CA13]|uniref:Alginate lyase n=1 Tax=Novipirellula herctigrandis TaxID=2527986 RepID=A0A5C5ZBW7_9BACT|nr:Alginate lyase [Planctomycetes bacterium CA13]